MQGAGLELLATAIGERLDVSARRHWLKLPPVPGPAGAPVCSGVVREERTGPEGDVLLLVELPNPSLRR